MTQRGLFREQINQETGIELEVLMQFLPEVLEETDETHALTDQDKRPHEISLGVSERTPYTLSSPEDCKTYSRTPPSPTDETKEPHNPQPTKTLAKLQPSTPIFLYCGKYLTSKLHRVNLLTGEQSLHELRSHRFNRYFSWSEMPGGSLLITGGGVPSLRTVVSLVVGTFAVSTQRPMHTARMRHASVYHSQYVYVLGGRKDGDLSECEKYHCLVRRWEVLSALLLLGR
jgi:hypothetical protein